MKFENNTTETTIRFGEQVKNVIELFKQWNDCERVVALYAVFKKAPLPYPLTKFIQSVIDTILQQSQCLEQAQTLEQNANSAKYINSLTETYKNFKCTDVQLPTDSIFFEADRSNEKLDKFYDKKEEILRDILKMMPILTIGNEEAKLAYLEFIPITVEDATRRIVNSTLVQQLFSYALIHPAFSTDDRRSVGIYLRDLEGHISSTNPNFFLYRNGTSPTSEPTNPSTPSNWQAIAPPQSKSTETIPSSWGSNHHLTPGYVDDNEYHRNQIEYKPAPSSSPQLSLLFESSSDDHHTSFQKNGTTVDDVDYDDTDKSNTQIGFLSLPSLTQHINVPGVMESAFKTRRSNSLTTTSSQSTRISLAPNSTNEKPRSFSLSGISTPLLLSGGSDNIFDESKLKFPPIHSPIHIGMSNIGQWLKNLRLHKYLFLFTHRTYEEMMDFTEDHFQNMNVTAGARKKLYNSIQKLKERYSVLCQVEKDFQCGKITIGDASKELYEIVSTPMKPIEPFNKQDVANQFLKLLDMVSTKTIAKLIVPQDEDHVNRLHWILDKAVHNEAFVAHTNLLKKHRHDIQRIKNQFPSKSHYVKGSSPAASSSSGNIHRSRQTSLYHDYFANKFPLSATSSYSTNEARKTKSMSLVSWLCPTTDPIRSNSVTCTRDLYSKVTSDPTPKLNLDHLRHIYAPPDSAIEFKKPLLPLIPLFPLQTPKPQSSQPRAPQPPRIANRISGSVESIVSEGYHSDGYPPGMNNIRAWLKSHRLHKYTWVFDSVTYDRMFSFNEQYFKSLNITLGASRKLAICIENLKTRHDELTLTEKTLKENRVFIPEAIHELTKMVMSPMKPMRLNTDGDVGYQFWKVLILVNSIIHSHRCDDESISRFLFVLDKSMSSEAFLDYTYTLRDMKMKINNKRLHGDF